MADLQNDTASPMEEDSRKSNNMQERSLPQKSAIMMVDVPEEETSSCKNAGNGPQCSPVTHSFSSSKPIFGSSSKLASPHLTNVTFGSNPFAMKPAIGGLSNLSCATSSPIPLGLSSSPKPVYLRPSQLTLGSIESPQQGTSHSPSPLKPPSLGNPFARVPQDSITMSSMEGVKAEDSSAPISEEVAISSSSSSSTSETHSTSSEAETVRHEGDRRGAVESSSVEVDGDSSSNSGISSCVSQRSLRGIMAPPKFVPLGTPSRHTEESPSAYGNKTSASTTSTTTVTPSSSTSTSVTGFVFGQNLHERVAEAVSHETSDMKSRTSEATGTSNNVSTVCTSATTNGTSEMLFTSVIKQDHNNESGHNNSSNISDHGEKRSKSLSEAAREYEEARAIKRKYEEVTIVTGEEDEINILQMNCKLFAFDKAGGTWVERGRGTLRLNDKDCGPEGGGVQSRVVIRTTGSLRVVLNTKIWAGMSVHRPSAKSVRLTAMDSSGQIKVFLVMSSPKDMEQLHKSLEYRVRLAQQASSAQTTQRDLSSHSLPPEPCSKKRLPQNVEDTGPSPGRKDVAPV